MKNLMLLSLVPKQVVSVTEEEEEDREWLRGHNCTTEVNVTKKVLKNTRIICSKMYSLRWLEAD
jgi:hypothetical protein